MYSLGENVSVLRYQDGKFSAINNIARVCSLFLIIVAIDTYYEIEFGLCLMYY